MEWMPIETLPPDEKIILVCGGTWESDISSPVHVDGPCLVFVPRHGAKRFHELGGDYYSSWVDRPTHWCAIPPLPTQEPQS